MLAITSFADRISPPRCDCAKGYTLSADHKCIPTSKTRPATDAKSATSAKPNQPKKSPPSAKKKPRSLWTRLVEAEIAQYLGILIAFLGAMYVVGRRNVVVQAVVIGTFSALLYWFCARVERAVLKRA